MIEITTLSQETLRIIHCYSCGVAFGVPLALDEALHRDKRDFYCPKGHRQHYTTSLRETVSRLRVDLAEAIAARDAAEQSRAALLARVETGTCPHCRRHFANLKRHVDTTHKKGARR